MYFWGFCIILELASHSLSHPQPCVHGTQKTSAVLSGSSCHLHIHSKQTLSKLTGHLGYCINVSQPPPAALWAVHGAAPPRPSRLVHSPGSNVGGLPFTHTPCPFDTWLAGKPLAFLVNYPTWPTYWWMSWWMSWPTVVFAHGHKLFGTITFPSNVLEKCFVVCFTPLKSLFFFWNHFLEVCVLELRWFWLPVMIVECSVKISNLTHQRVINLILSEVAGALCAIAPP